MVLVWLLPPGKETVMDFYEKWKEESKAYKPKKETAQHVLWLKQMALMSPHFEESRKGKDIISEPFLNACMQMAYDRGRELIDERSFRLGKAAAMKEVAEKLGLSCECCQ